MVYFTSVTFWEITWENIEMSFPATEHSTSSKEKSEPKDSLVNYLAQ